MRGGAVTGDVTSIRFAGGKSTMNKRTATFWFPALCSLTAAMGSLMIFRQLGLRPNTLWVGRMDECQSCFTSRGWHSCLWREVLAHICPGAREEDSLLASLLLCFRR